MRVQKEVCGERKRCGAAVSRWEGTTGGRGSSKGLLRDVNLKRVQPKCCRIALILVSQTLGVWIP